MIPGEEWGIILVFTGIVLLITGSIGFVIPYQPIHLVTVGTLLFFGGYYWYTAVKKKSKKEPDKI